MIPQRLTRSFLFALFILALILAVAGAMAFSADAARGTEVEPGPLEDTEHSFDPLETEGTTPPGTTPDTAPPEANETEAHLEPTGPTPVRVAPHYTG